MSYAALTERNAAFLGVAEQSRLGRASALVLGVGGMGGAAVQSLVRAGLGRVAIADGDAFEASNLNRQIFATTRTLSRQKTAVTRDGLLDINPELAIETFGPEWIERLDALLPHYPVVVNAMDDLRAGILLYRKAREHGATVIDAYTSPCPSVTVVSPHDPRPEERLGFPTVGLPWERIGEAQLREAFLREVAYVVSTSSGIRQLDPAVVAEIIAGTRPRSSFAPVVMIAGNLMAFEAIQALLGRPSGAGARGYFVNPWTGRVERPRRGPVQRLLARVAFARLAALAGDGSA